MIALLSRCRLAWRALSAERRLAAGAALVLILALFLPWYQLTAVGTGRHGHLQALSRTASGWGVFSGIEALLLLLGGGVLALLFRTAEGRLRLPGGDGWLLLFAGAVASVLVVIRIFDKPGSGTPGRYATTSGIDWGILVALAAALLLTYAAWRIRRPGELQGLTAAPSPSPAAPLDFHEEPLSQAAAAGIASNRAGPGAGAAGNPPRPVAARPRPASAASGPRPRPASGARGARRDVVDPAPTPATRLLRTIGRRPPTEPQPGGRSPTEPQPGKRSPLGPQPGRGEPSDRPTGWLSAPPAHRRAGSRPDQPPRSPGYEPDQAE
jgi:hypothetical protein